MNAEKLSITLPADMAQMVRRQVEGGAYASNSEVIREALRLWQDREEARGRRLDVIRAKINEAAESEERITDDDVRKHFENRLTEAERKPSP